MHFKQLFNVLLGLILAARLISPSPFNADSLLPAWRDHGDVSAPLARPRQPHQLAVLYMTRHYPIAYIYPLS